MSSEEVNWLTWMTTIGFPKCGKKESFGINVKSSLEKDLPSITKNDLLDMKLGTYIIWYDICSHKITDINKIMRLTLQKYFSNPPHWDTISRSDYQYI